MCRSKYDPNIRDTLIMTRNIALSFMVTDVLPVPTSYKLGSGNKFIDASMTILLEFHFQPDSSSTRLMITVWLLSTGGRDLSEAAFKDFETRGEQTASHQNIYLYKSYDEVCSAFKACKSMQIHLKAFKQM